MFDRRNQERWGGRLGRDAPPVRSLLLPDAARAGQHLLLIELLLPETAASSPPERNRQPAAGVQGQHDADELVNQALP